MSLREIDFSLRKIAKRKNHEYITQAAFHGIKIDEPVEEEATEVKISEKHQKEIERLEKMNLADRLKAIRES